jgi:hypothetical protein
MSYIIIIMKLIATLITIIIELSKHLPPTSITIIKNNIITRVNLLLKLFQIKLKLFTL